MQPTGATPSAADEKLWQRLERFLKAGTLVPVIGPGCITFGKDDQPLYPWLAEQLVERLGIEIPDNIERPLDLHDVAGIHLATSRRTTDLTDLTENLYDLLDAPDLEPGPLLCDLARIGAFNHYFTLGFDPLLERAISKVRYGGQKKPEVWEFSLDQPPVDLPFGTKEPPRALLAYLFGRVSPSPSFHLWDNDAIEFVWSLQRAMPSLNTLATTLTNNNLIFLGTDFSDWLARFFLRVVRNKPLNQGKLQSLLTERMMHRDAGDVVFYDALGGGIDVVTASPLTFAREFATRALRGFALPDQVAAPPRPPVDREMPRGAVFLSYCRVDKDFANRVFAKLQAHGCLVWMDTQDLQAGDDYNKIIRNAINDCTVFLSLVTPTTETTEERYYHLERRLAAERLKKFAPGSKFYLPLAAEGVPLPPRREPNGIEDVLAMVVAGGEIPDSMCLQIVELQKQRLGNR